MVKVVRKPRLHDQLFFFLSLGELWVFWVGLLREGPFFLHVGADLKHLSKGFFYIDSMPPSSPVVESSLFQQQGRKMDVGEL